MPVGSGLLDIGVSATAGVSATRFAHEILASAPDAVIQIDSSNPDKQWFRSVNSRWLQTLFLLKASGANKPSVGMTHLGPAGDFHSCGTGHMAYAIVMDEDIESLYRGPRGHLRYLTDIPNPIDAYMIENPKLDSPYSNDAAVLTTTLASRVTFACQYNNFDLGSVDYHSIEYNNFDLGSVDYHSLEILAETLTAIPPQHLALAIEWRKTLADSLQPHEPSTAFRAFVQTRRQTRARVSFVLLPHGSLDTDASNGACPDDFCDVGPIARRGSVSPAGRGRSTQYGHLVLWSLASASDLERRFEPALPCRMAVEPALPCRKLSSLCFGTGLLAKGWPRRQLLHTASFRRCARGLERSASRQPERHDGPDCARQDSGGAAPLGTPTAASERPWSDCDISHLFPVARRPAGSSGDFRGICGVSADGLVGGHPGVASCRCRLRPTARRRHPGVASCRCRLRPTARRLRRILRRRRVA